MKKETNRYICAKEDDLFARTNEGEGYTQYQRYIRNSVFCDGRVNNKVEELLQEEVEEMIICSAIKIINSEIIRGHRHHDCIRSAKDIPRLKGERLLHQGFITSKNRFVEREEAKLIAEKAGQMIKKTNSPLLFSEDIY